MTAQLLASELGNLIQESKRKNNDLRQVRYQSRHESLYEALLTRHRSRLRKSHWRSSRVSERRLNPRSLPVC